MPWYPFTRYINPTEGKHFQHGDRPMGESFGSRDLQNDASKVAVNSASLEDRACLLFHYIPDLYLPISFCFIPLLHYFSRAGRAILRKICGESRTRVCWSLSRPPQPMHLCSPSPDASGFGWNERSGRAENVKSKSPGFTHPNHNGEAVPEMGTSQEHMDGGKLGICSGPVPLNYYSQTHLRN